MPHIARSPAAGGMAGRASELLSWAESFRVSKPNVPEFQLLPLHPFGWMSVP